ncbi:MAG: UDP-N-acetylmuramoyl-tripeptide--D-alanyl-D-alanine ligase [Candidatus Dormibacteria bacterium]
MTTIEVMSHTPAGLAALFGGELEGDGDATQVLGDIVTDSRRVRPGGVFIALRGRQDDGHRHLAEAAARGAALAVADPAGLARMSCAGPSHTPGDPAGSHAGAERGPGYAGPSEPPLRIRVPDTGAALREACRRRLRELGCTVVAITGSVGKTTVKDMCAHVLEEDRHVGRTLGNLNTWTGIPLSVLALEPPVDVFVAELAMSAPGEIRDLAGFTRPGVAVVLNVGLAHVGLLGSLDAISAAKAELLESLTAGGIAVVNADDERVVAMADRLRREGPGCRIIRFGLAPGSGADYSAANLDVKGLTGSGFVLRGPDGTAEVHLPVPGVHAVLNACAAAAVAGQIGVGVAHVAERLATFSVPDQRGRVVTSASGAAVYDDSYNSSPTSLQAALEVLAESGAQRRVAVLGDMLELGHEALGRHREAGRRAAAAATDLVAVGEYATVMRQAAVDAGMPAGRTATAADADMASMLLGELLERCRPASRNGRDVAVLVKGSHSVGLERVVESLVG